MNTEKQLTLEEFAEQVRRDSATIMSRAAFGHSIEAATLAGQLCQKAADIVQQAKMAEETAGGYDLAALSGLPMDAPETKD